MKEEPSVSEKIDAAAPKIAFSRPIAGLPVDNYGREPPGTTLHPRQDEGARTAAIAVHKGRDERLVLSPCTKDGRAYVNVVWQAEGPPPFTLWCFALRPDEARELAAGLLSMADTVASLPTPDEGEDG